MNAVLIREGKNRGDYKNIGDFIQSIAQRQYWNNVDCIIDIEELSDIKSNETLNVIMNGWFMWNPSKFPPSSCINPLFVSFHLAPAFEDQFFTNETVSYLKKYEPIGTRDTATMGMMKKHGIDSYFSGCLTLTLDKTYLQEKRDDNIYIIDPIVCYSYRSSMMGKMFSIISLVVSIIINYKKIKRLSKIFYHQDRTPFSRISKAFDYLLETAAYYRNYSKCFSDEILFNATYMSQIVDNNASVEEKFKMADDRLKKFSTAKLVITRRIHAALPCLALRTPVVLTINEDIISNIPKQNTDGGRFGGILELFNYMKFTEKGVWAFGCDSFVTEKNIPQNPSKYLYYRNLLDRQVNDFINKIK